MKKYKSRLEGTAILVPRIKSNDMLDLKQALSQVTHQGIIERWRPLAEKYGATELLEMAEKLIDNGKVTDLTRFDYLTKKAISKIKAKSNEQEILPHAQKDIKRVKNCKLAGIESGKTRKKKIEQKHDNIIQQAITLLDNGKPRRDITDALSKRTGYTTRHISTILKKAGL